MCQEHNRGSFSEPESWVSVAVGWGGGRVCPCVQTALPPANAVCADTWRPVIVTVLPPLLTRSGDCGKDAPAQAQSVAMAVPLVGENGTRH